MALKLRPVTEEDKKLADVWTKTDEYHKNLNPNFWYKTEPGVQCLVVEDSEGPTLFVRLESEVRAFVQFSPTVGKMRTAKALAQAIGRIGALAKKKGYRAIVFDTVSKSLAKFCERLGFSSSENEYRKVLED